MIATTWADPVARPHLKAIFAESQSGGGRRSCSLGGDLGVGGLVGPTTPAFAVSREL